MFRFLFATRHRRRSLTIAFVITTVTVLAELPWALRVVPGASLLARLEMKLIDFRFQRRGGRRPPVDVVIAAIDEDAIRQEGQWPWPRKRMADVVSKLAQAGARAVVLDIFYTERDPAPGGAESDRELAWQTRQAGRVFHAWFGDTVRASTTPLPADQVAELAERGWPLGIVGNPGHELMEYVDVTPPLPELTAASSGVGFAELRDSGDGIFRFYDLAAVHEGRYYPSLALAVATVDLRVDPQDVVIELGREARLGDQVHIPLVSDGAMLLDFYGPSGTIPHLSVADLLADRLPAKQVAGRIVIVGVTAKGAYELRPSPFGAVFYGVEMQATAIANFLDHRGLKASGLLADLLITIILGAAAGLALTLWRPAPASALSLVLFVGYNSLCTMAFVRADYLLPMAAPNVAILACVLAVLLYRLSTEERQRNRITETFGLFVPPKVVEELTSEEAELEAFQAERRQITVLFADVRDFTAYAERREPEDVMELLNRYFSLMHEVVWQFGGTLDKYMGDGLLAFFGAPTHQQDHAEQAVLAALEMQRQVRVRRDEWEPFGMHDLRVGMGLDTGEVLVGFAGSEGRMQYTCMGNVVNLASRLEEQTRERETDILISAELYDRVKHLVVAESVGSLTMRGLSSKVETYCVIGKREDASETEPSQQEEQDR